MVFIRYLGERLGVLVFAPRQPLGGASDPPRSIMRFFGMGYIPTLRGVPGLIVSCELAVCAP